jgi:hypothetical protein
MIINKLKILGFISVIFFISQISACGNLEKDNQNITRSNHSSASNKETDITNESNTSKINQKNENNKIEVNSYEAIDNSKSLLETGKYYDYEGSINEELKIQMSLYKLDSSIVGTYFYESQGKELRLEGKADNKSIVLFEYDDNGKNTGVFEGSMKTIDTFEGFEGTWSDGQKKIPFKVKTKFITSGEYGRRYATAVGEKTDEEVENFTKNIKMYLSNDDKQKLAKLINYPIKLKVNGEITNIKDENDFIENYDNIFHKECKKAIENSFTKYMFVNWRGIMFGGNQYNMWINEVIGVTDMKITTINN